MVIAGAVLFAGSAVLFIIALSQSRKLAAMQRTETSLASDLREIASSVAAEIGAGSFAQAAEVKGLVRCDHPLVSELSETACVHYAIKVSREYEETSWTTQSGGQRTQQTRRGSEVVSQNARSVPFEVEDSSGRIAVEPEGAKIVAERVLSRFEPGEVGSEGLRLGRFALRFTPAVSPRRTLGYRYEEHAVPVDREVYILAEASDSGGRLRLQRPTARGGRFIISVKSEEELSRRARLAVVVLRSVAVIADVAGAALIAARVLRP